MSIIRKKPVIEDILGKLTDAQLNSLIGAINNTGGSDSFYSFYDKTHLLPALTNDAPTHIAPIIFQLDQNNVRNAIAVRFIKSAVNYEYLFVYGESQKITIYEINSTNFTYKLIEEQCTVLELRFEIANFRGSEGQTDEWVRSMKEVMEHDEEQNEVQCGVHFYCDGDLETGTDVVVGRDLIVDSLQNIQDPNGDAFIPDPSGHLKEALVHNTTGYTWYKGYELAGFQVIAKSVFEGDGFVYETHKVYFVWNDTAGDHYGEVYIRYYEA